MRVLRSAMSRASGGRGGATRRSVGRVLGGSAHGGTGAAVSRGTCEKASLSSSETFRAQMLDRRGVKFKIWNAGSFRTREVGASDDRVSTIIVNNRTRIAMRRFKVLFATVVGIVAVECVLAVSAFASGPTSLFRQEVARQY